MNILAQDITIRIYIQSYSLIVSAMIGTVVGLFIKYILDKKYIFYYKTNNFLDDARVFSIYVFLGILTTLIFWGFEFTFDFLFKQKVMRYLGAVIGLTIGYVIKYSLDKRFVFVKENIK